MFRAETFEGQLAGQCIVRSSRSSAEISKPWRESLHQASPIVSIVVPFLGNLLGS